jgi:alpha,alpha-trehalase
VIRLRVTEHLHALLAQEDTDGDKRITVRDRGPRRYPLDGFTVEGTYALSNLLQELALAQEQGKDFVEVEPAELHLKPTERLSRSIRERCWAGLTRRIDGQLLPLVLHDEKMPSTPRLYLPQNDKLAWDYYRKLQTDFPFELLPLAAEVTPEYVLSLNERPGLLGLAHDTESGEPLPYVVPGGRFNEMYGWDCYFIGLGLLQDGLVELAQNLVNHQVYQIRHYGQVLNANRSYYLTRSQPPFLTAFARAVWERLPAGRGRAEWLQSTLVTAMAEYETVWTGSARQTSTGLSRYLGRGIGIPPETEPGHYDAVLRPYAQEFGMSVQEFEKAYLRREVRCAELDGYFTHDRTVRESGHDTSYRLEGRAADLCTVDLNSLLFRYETDIAELLERHFDGKLPGHAAAHLWRSRAEQRRQRMNDHCWDEARGSFFDYDFARGEHTGYESATNLWPIWAGLATQRQAETMLERLLPSLLCTGGVAATSEASRGPLGPDRPVRQWDYPYGWAPHQMLLWDGLSRYGLRAEAGQLAQRWLRMMTKNAVDFNGVIPEKYDVMTASHEVFAEYGNVGADFDYITREGFGWSNAAYQVGLTYLSEQQRRELDELAG